jgi:pimeloyl-ACP methyl ester carboxylesterase
MTLRIGYWVDGLVGTMSRVLYALRGAEHDTVADLVPYLDRPPRELYPAPTRMPVARRTRTLRSLSRAVEDVTFASEHQPVCSKYARRHEGEYRCNHDVHLRWVHPLNGPRKSILLYVHGWMEPGAWVEETALFPQLYREVGVDVAHVQLPFHGKRKPRASYFHGEFYWSADLVRTMEAVRQSVIDVESSILWFRAMGYEQIGVAGISLGGAITMVTACLPPGPDYVVPIVAHLDIADAVENAPILWRMKADLERFGIDEAQRRALIQRLPIASLRPVLPPERQLWIAARDDRYLSAACVERQWETWGRPPIVWIPGGHMTFPVALKKIVSSIASFREGLAVPFERSVA